MGWWQRLHTQFVASPNGTHIAYDVSGSGPLLLLVHALGVSRRIWHEAGMVEALSPSFTVAALDLRGHGESDKPVAAAMYTAEKLLDDLCAVADTIGADRFSYWGHSYGATIGIQAAAQLPRVARAVIAGSFFGRQADEEWLKQAIAGMEQVVRAEAEGRLDELGLTPQQRESLAAISPTIMLACLKGIATFPGVEPPDVRCPLLVYTGTRDHALEPIEAQRHKMEVDGVRLTVFEGLDHQQLVTARETVLPPIRAFLCGEAYSLN
jgi:pimeloyl-ACP methyl ester carboxylesterase